MVFYLSYHCKLFYDYLTALFVSNVAYKLVRISIVLFMCTWLTKTVKRLFSVSNVIFLQSMHKRIQSQWHKNGKSQTKIIECHRERKHNLTYFAFHLLNVINYTHWRHSQKIQNLAKNLFIKQVKIIQCETLYGEYDI